MLCQSGQVFFCRLLHDNSISSLLMFLLYFHKIMCCIISRLSTKGLQLGTPEKEVSVMNIRIWKVIFDTFLNKKVFVIKILVFTFIKEMLYLLVFGFHFHRMSR